MEGGSVYFMLPEKWRSGNGPGVFPNFILTSSDGANSETVTVNPGPEPRPPDSYYSTLPLHFKRLNKSLVNLFNSMAS